MSFKDPARALIRDGSVLHGSERTAFALLLLAISLGAGADLYSDLATGVGLSHLATEGAVGLGALAGVLLLGRRTMALKRQVRIDAEVLRVAEDDARLWKAENARYIQGLSQAIDAQLDDWELTVSEKEVALLLLKGLSLKEVAEIRRTSERTVRQQALAVYSKSGVGGRAELSAYFLEDLLAPGAGSLA